MSYIYMCAGCFAAIAVGFVIATANRVVFFSAETIVVVLCHAFLFMVAATGYAKYGKGYQ
jgi:hypothetical protein